ANRDLWCQEVLDATEQQDQPALEKLAGNVDAARHPPALLLLLARALPGGPARLDLVRRVPQADPGGFWGDLYLGGFSEESPDWDDAIRYFTAAAALRPESPGAHYNLGTALHRKGRLDEAISEYQEAIRLKKDDPEAHNNLGVALKDKGRLDEAISEY